MKSFLRRHWDSLLLALAAIGGITWLLRTSETAREVAGDAFWLLFTFFSTPFVLESTVGLLGLALLLTWNKHRLQKETENEWVEMEVQVPDKAGAKSSAQADAVPPQTH